LIIRPPSFVIRLSDHIDIGAIPRHQSFPHDIAESLVAPQDDSSGP
jgi:hypothetical protein